MFHVNFKIIFFILLLIFFKEIFLLNEEVFIRYLIYFHQYPSQAIIYSCIGILIAATIWYYIVISKNTVICISQLKLENFFT
jgi:hypothetical protein